MGAGVADSGCKAQLAVLERVAAVVLGVLVQCCVNRNTCGDSEGGEFNRIGGK